MFKMKRQFVTLIIFFIVVSAFAQKTYYCQQEGDTLIIGNDQIERKFIWNGGNLMTYSLSNKASGKIELVTAPLPDLLISKTEKVGTKGLCRT